MTQTRILLVDDMQSVLTTVAEILRNHFEIVGMVSHSLEVFGAAEALSPEVIVMDISMPGITGIDITKELRLRGSQARIVFLTVHEDSDIAASAMAAGGSGYVLKELMGSDLVPAIRDSLAGRAFLSRFPR